MDVRQATDHKSSRIHHHSFQLLYVRTSYRLSPTSTSHEQAAMLFCQKCDVNPKIVDCIFITLQVSNQIFALLCLNKDATELKITGFLRLLRRMGVSLCKNGLAKQPAIPLRIVLD